MNARSRTRWLARAVVVPVTAVALVLLAGASAGATPAGSNGLISYRVYFDANHTTGALFVMNPNGTHRMQITFPGAGNLDTNQNWSPGGRRIVYEHDTADGSSSIWVVGALGQNPHRIVACPRPGRLANCAGVFNPSWSPNGRWIAFELVLDPFDATGNPADDTIWAVHPNGRGLRKITHRVGGTSSDQNPQWSPDSRRIVFQRNQAPDFTAEIWTANSTTGRGLVRVSPPGVSGADHPDYSPNGRWIMFRTDNGVTPAKLMIAHPNGTGLRTVLYGGNTRSFFSSSFSPNGKAFTVGIAPGVAGNADVFVGRFGRGMRVVSLTNITHSKIWESSPRWGTAPLLH